MRQHHRLSRVLSALVHLDAMDRPATSKLIAQLLQANTAVVRHLMAGLRDPGIVTAVKGHGDGWSLLRSLDKLTLMDIYRAPGKFPLFATGADEVQASCVLAKAANAATTDALRKAQMQFETLLAETTVAQIGQTPCRLDADSDANGCSQTMDKAVRPVPVKTATASGKVQCCR